MENLEKILGSACNRNSSRSGTKCSCRKRHDFDTGRNVGKHVFFRLGTPEANRGLFCVCPNRNKLVCLKLDFPEFQWMIIILSPFFHGLLEAIRSIFPHGEPRSTELPRDIDSNVYQFPHPRMRLGEINDQWLFSSSQTVSESCRSTSFPSWTSAPSAGDSEGDFVTISIHK